MCFSSRTFAWQCCQWITFSRKKKRVIPTKMKVEIVKIWVDSIDSGRRWRNAMIYRCSHCGRDSASVIQEYSWFWMLFCGNCCKTSMKYKEEKNERTTVPPAEMPVARVKKYDII